MVVELLNEESVIPYLRERGIIEGSASCEVLTGGVSNIVLAVTTATQELVLKQALAELKVATLWKADQRRAIVEANALKLFHSITPQFVPEMVDMDPKRFTLVLSRVAQGGTVWKEDLLAGVIKPEIAAVLGEVLAKWHNYGVEHPSARENFQEDLLFDQLRIDPFYRYVAAANPDLANIIFSLINELTENKTTLVHGDFSPKNIMVLGAHPFILDFEVTHTGNPVFDLAFLSAHLLCKFFRTENLKERELLKECATSFISNYGRVSSNLISPLLSSHTALIALARVEGKSPVNYLDERSRNQLVLRTKEALRTGTTYDELFRKIA